MRYRINNYQLIYAGGCRDKVRPSKPIYTDDIEAERTKIKQKHSGLGVKLAGVNLEYEILK